MKQKNYPTAENLGKLANALKVEAYKLFVVGGVKSNAELLNKILKCVQKISKDNRKLHVALVAVKSLL